MKNLHFERLKLITILLLFQNVCRVNLTDEFNNEINEIEEDTPESSVTRLHVRATEAISIPEGNESPGTKDDLYSGIYRPLIIYRKGEGCTYDLPKGETDNTEFPPWKYWYFCPAESDYHLKQSYLACKGQYCLLLKASGTDYDSEIRCKYEVLPSVKETNESCGRGFSNWRFHEALALEVFAKNKDQPEDPTKSRKRPREGCFIFDWIFQWNPDKPNRPHMKRVLSITEQTLMGENIQIAIYTLSVFRFCFNRNSHQTYFAMHVITKSLSINQSSSRSTAVTEEMWKSLGNIFFSNFDQRQSYIKHNKVAARLEESKIVAQPFVPQEDLSPDGWANATLFEFNTAPLMSELADLWGEIHICLQLAAQKFDRNLIVYTGILGQKEKKSNGNTEIHSRNMDLHLIRRSFVSAATAKSSNITLANPRIWFKIVGTLESNESLIIVLNNHKRNIYKSGFANCVFPTGRWNDVHKPIFSSDLLTHPNIIMCTLDKSIVDKEKFSTTEGLNLLLQGYEDPAAFVKEVIDPLKEIGDIQSDILLEELSKSKNFEGSEEAVSQILDQIKGIEDSQGTHKGINNFTVT